MGEKRSIRNLFDRYRKGTATASEKEMMAGWLQQLDALDKHLPEERIDRYAERSRSQLRQRLMQEQQPSKIRHLYRRVAAACLLAGVLTFYFTREQRVTELAHNYIAEGHSQLRLGDHLSIDLDLIHDTVIAVDGGAHIRIHGHDIRYEGAVPSKPTQHTLITAMGQRYRLLLHDSSRIWVNGGSSLHYPSRFQNTTRTAQVQGEAYFEVTKAANWPFVVKAANDRLSVQVLGTAFNIAAWQENDAVQTTLVSGSVQLNVAGHPGKTLLKPSQKAVYSLRDKAMQVQTLLSTDLETDWVYDRLTFRETPMPEVLARLTRFYNVDFEVKNKRIQQYTFTGTFENKPLEKVLDYMRITSNIRYAIRKEKNRRVVELK